VEDVARMSRTSRRKLVSVSETLWATDMVEHFERSPSGACAFLRGTPGERVSCRIYETRPAICRAFEPGSRACLSSRVWLEHAPGLEQLMAMLVP
jgi:Fe-S-cluster containining protein